MIQYPKIFVHHAGSLLMYILTTLLIGVRSLLGPAACRYEIGCTQFVITQLETLPLHHAVYCSIKRVLSCNPFFKDKNYE